MCDTLRKTRGQVKKNLDRISLLETSRDIKGLIKCIKTPYYMLKPYLWSLRTIHIDRRIGISKRWNYAYIRIPKCANSLVTVNLDYYLPEDGRYPRESPRIVQNARKNFYRPRDLSRKEIRYLMGKGYIFTVVRNPYHRILSAYLDKIKRPKYLEKYGSEIKNAGENDLSFTSFCMWLNSGNHNKDPHWYPQVDYINIIGMSNVDYIVDIDRVGNLINRVVYLFSNTNPDHIYDPHFGNHGSDEHRTHAANKTYRYYNDTSIEVVQKLYSDDFEMLGYDPSIIEY